MEDDELLEEKDAKNVDEELQLTDIFDVEMLQRVQDAFSSMTGIAVLTTDAHGVPVTKGSKITDFCGRYTRSTPIGGFRCEQCDIDGAQRALECGHSLCYTCHTGMVDFAAPIMANGRMIGCFVGGQVRTKPPDIAQIFQVAREIGVDAISYLQSALEVPIMKQEEIDRAADFLYTIADIISSITYHKYVMHKANIEIEKVAHMKSDFLANMSHEIRTPMNAVIGMAEMALREEMSSAARDYINQIKTSGKTLLTIINDILDFSKIESGKMSIVEAEYEPLSLINDVSNMIMTRIGEKNVELILDVAPDIPCKLNGDGVRIKQVLTNIANNAVKFTEEGNVTVSINYEKVSDDVINILVAVKDTGIGIKEEDLSKLFQSFQQLDSKRNRNIEGTGLGLAISKQLLALMGGHIEVESEYGKGTTFSFSVPQKVVDDKPAISLKEDKKNITVAALVDKDCVREQLKKDIERLGAKYEDIKSAKKITKQLNDKKIQLVFIDYSLFSKEVESFVKQNPEYTAVLMTPFDMESKYDIDNLIIVKKPLYSLNISMLLNGENLHTYFVDDENDNIDFIAPEATILIVDDNAINLTVAKGLLKPLQMQMDTALSGKEAIEKISQKHYDLIFMDHMMPEIDGVETTHIIRRFHEEYNNVPIIALTANAVEGTKEMFLQEGMNDFVAKPIEMRELVAKLRLWLPKDKIQKASQESESVVQNEKEEELVIEGLDTKSALSMLGSKELYLDVLKDYYHVIDRKENIIREMIQNKDWHGYTIEVHALKSASKQIGANELSQQAAELEKAGNEENIAAILMNTDSMLDLYHSYKDILAPLFTEEKKQDTDKQDVSPETLKEIFAQFDTALDDLDMDNMEETINTLSQYKYPDWQQELFEQLKVAVDSLDVDACASIRKEWESRL